MTVDEIRKSAEPKHECECERLKKQIAELAAEGKELQELLSSLPTMMPLFFQSFC